MEMSIIVQSEQFEKMKLKLKDTITMKDYIPSKFQIFAWEAGLGKSKYSTEYVADAIEEAIIEGKPIPTFIIVKKFVRDVEQTTTKLKEYSFLNGEEGVIGLTSETWQEKYAGNLRLLEDAMIVVMTHQRYIDICKSEPPTYFKNKQTLIIDEKVQFPTYDFSKNKYDKIRSQFPYSIQKEFDKINESLLLKLEEHDSKGTNQIRIDKLDFETIQINAFKDLLVKKKFSLSKDVSDYLEHLNYFYNQTLLYNNKKFNTINRNYKFRMLENNIILDASAVVDSIYDSQKFIMVEERRILDYSKSKLLIENTNSSKSSMNNEYFMKDIARFAPFITGNQRKCLFITHKSKAKELKKELELKGLKVHIAPDKALKEERYELNIEDVDAAINWFGNIVGQNEYSEFDMCCIVGTFNLPYPVYILQYVLYNDFEGFENWDLEIKRGKFIEPKLEEIRQGTLAAEFYQALKRIQRNDTPNGIFSILIKDEDIYNKVTEQLSGIFSITVNRVWVEKPEKSKDTLVEKLYKYLKGKPIGKYKKKTVYTELEMDGGNFGRLFNEHPILEYLENGSIDNSGQYITIFKVIK